MTKVSSLDVAVTDMRQRLGPGCRMSPLNLIALEKASLDGNGFTRRKESSMVQVMSDLTPSLSFQSASMTMLRYQSH